MRMCRHCQHINGDSETHCRRCGGEIASQICLSPDAPIPRAIPDTLARRNRRALLALLLLPAILALNVLFWAEVVPGFFAQADRARAARLQVHQHSIDSALARCHGDTGGVPAHNLLVLTYSRVTAADLTPGADPRQWRGPYVTTPFPANPYRPHDGVRGWQYHLRNGRGTVTPAQQMP